MSDIGMIFQAWGVRAILAGLKTQTRRIPTARNSLVDGKGVSAKRWAAFDWDWGRSSAVCLATPEDEPYILLNAGDGQMHSLTPRAQVGDVIWVRETVVLHCDRAFRYAADAEWKHIPAEGADWYMRHMRGGIHRTPSIFMPRWACRIERRLTGVRAERVQDIGPEDVIAEGFVPEANWQSHAGGREQVIADFGSLWDSINAKRAPWSDNRPVYVYDWEDPDTPPAKDGDNATDTPET